MDVLGVIVDCILSASVNARFQRISEIISANNSLYIYDQKLDQGIHFIYRMMQKLF